MAEYVAAIDQGTTSSRLILFDKDGQIECVDQKEHEQITPKAGWVEHDAKEIWRKTREVIGGAIGAYVYDLLIRGVLIARGVKPDPEMTEEAQTTIEED